MTENQNTALRAPHPTANYIAVAPIPQPDEAVPTHEIVELAPGIQAIHRRRQSGVLSGVVVERGPMPDTVEPEVLMPFEVGATVWYGETAKIEVGGFHYLPANQVICWDEAPA